MADATDGNVHPVWERFFERAKADGLTFEILIHTKKQPERFKQYILLNSVETTWKANLPAHVILVAEAKQRGVDKVVFLSESCIPVTAPELVWNRLALWDKTLLNKVRVLREDQKKYFNYPALHKDIWKAEQWGAVDKRHFGLYENADLVNKFKGTLADNEAFLILALREANEGGNALCFTDKNEIHHVKWPLFSSPNPVHYFAPDERAAVLSERKIHAQLVGACSPQLIKDLQKTAIFARKFSHNIDLSTLINAIGL